MRSLNHKLIPLTGECYDGAVTPSHKRSRRGTTAKNGLLVVFGTALGLAAAEAWLHTPFAPMPKRQIVAGNRLREIGGVPVWEAGDSRERQHLDCAERYPRRRRVLFFGTSITHGSGVSPEETFTALLEKRLNVLRPDPGVCVMNMAQPAFRPAQRYALAAEALPKYRPAAVLVQEWNTEWPGSCGRAPEFKILGDAAYGVMRLPLRGDGFPGLAGVPDFLNRRLFLRSRLYRYLVLAQTGEDENCAPGMDLAYHLDYLRKFSALSRSVGAGLAFFIVPDLSYPLTETRPRDASVDAEIVEAGRRSGFSVHPLRPLLADLDSAEIRLDSFHFNAAGHRALAERFTPIVLKLLDAPREASGAATR